MDNIIKFENSDFGEIRVTYLDGCPWFVAKDICDALTIKNNRDAVSKLSDDEKAMSVVPTQFGDKDMWVVNESGLYSLIFQSRKEEAQKFRLWVTGEVIPMIRRTGMYLTKEKMEEVMANPQSMVMMVDAYKEAIKELSEKSRYLNLINDSSAKFTTTEVAKSINLRSPQELNSILVDLGIIYKTRNTYALSYKYYGMGLAKINTELVTHSDERFNLVGYELNWTEKGRDFIYNKLRENGYKVEKKSF